MFFFFHLFTHDATEVHKSMAAYATLVAIEDLTIYITNEF